MSKEISLDVLLDHAGSDYDDLPADVKAMCDEVEADLSRVGIDIDHDLAATEAADALTEEAPASVTVTRDKGAPESFASRGKARAFVSANPGYKVVDNGVGSAARWTVAEAGSGSTAVRTKTKKAPTATTVTTPAAAERAPGKKETALAVYAELEAAGTLKRSNFLAEMETRTGLSAKGASSYFYRIKGGKW